MPMSIRVEFDARAESEEISDLPVHGWRFGFIWGETTYVMRWPDRGTLR
jgi:hypothetical protein